MFKDYAVDAVEWKSREFKQTNDSFQELVNFHVHETVERSLAELLADLQKPLTSPAESIEWLLGTPMLNTSLKRIVYDANSPFRISDNKVFHFNNTMFAPGSIVCQVRFTMLKFSTLNNCI